MCVLHTQTPDRAPMTISDPAQLLERIPELESLAEHPGILKAIATGDTFKVYRALWWARLLRKLPQHKRTLDALLRNRRLFAKPLKGTPSLGSINSVGFSFVGESERDADGSHIALHAFVVLFAIPLIPLGSYWVKRESSSGLSSSWRIFARVPMGGFGWLYGRGLAAAALGLIGLGGYSAFHASGHQEVTVVNGFDKPVKVLLAGQAQTVAAHGIATIDVPDGKVEGRADLEDGTEIERFSHEVHASADHAVWNIGGVAPVYNVQVIYYAENSTPPADSEQPSPTFHCGESYFETDHIDFAFEEPAQSVSMSKGQERAERSAMLVYADNGKQSQNDCVNYALSRGDLKAYSGMLVSLAAATKWDGGISSLAYMSALESESGKAIEIARRARDAHPDDMDQQRMYIGAMDDAGRLDEAKAEIARMVAKAPDSVSARYLDAVTTEGGAGLDKLLAIHGADNAPYVLRSTIWREWVAGRTQSVVDHWDALFKLSPEEAARVIEAKVDAELLLGHPGSALKALNDLAGTPAGENDPKIASYYALVAARGGDAPDALFRRIDAEKTMPSLLRYHAARANVSLAHPPETERDELAGLARELPESAERGLQRVRGLRDMEMRAIEPEHWALLYGEAARRKERALMTRLGHWSAFSSKELKRMADYALGQPVALEGLDIDPITHAALDLVRSRNDSLPQSERSRLHARALAGDHLHGAISVAAASWQ